VELRHLRYFVAVAESLHFGQAAIRLQIAQPSLSHQIQQLEAELQTSLLRRTKRRVELTEAGRVFLEEARDILGRADRAAMVARRAGRAEAGRLRIGVGYCMDQAEVCRAVSVFTCQYQAVRVELQTLAVTQQFTALRDQQMDVGFVLPPVSDSSLSSESLVREP
jgi:DNA-binding transcriptional LysR family regulator